jgi:hypothetical protein
MDIYLPKGDEAEALYNSLNVLHKYDLSNLVQAFDEADATEVRDGILYVAFTFGINNSLQTTLRKNLGKARWEKHSDDIKKVITYADQLLKQYSNADKPEKPTPPLRNKRHKSRSPDPVSDQQEETVFFRLKICSLASEDDDESLEIDEREDEEDSDY